MATVAILPVKRFDAAKRRLSEAIAPEGLLTLVEAMVADVLGALSSCRSVQHILVVSSEARASGLAAAVGAELLEDPPDPGHNPAARRGIERAVALGASRALLVPGDCPALDVAELEQLLAADGSPSPQVVIVPDRHGTGTNALLLSPPAVLEPSFGPGSAARHRERARTAAAACEIVRPSSLLLDVDTPADLSTLAATLAQRDPGVAPRTRALLDAGAIATVGPRASATPMRGTP